MKTLHNTLRDAVRRLGLLRAGERVAVACSGGADSVALLLLLYDLRSELGIRLSVAHLNHQLRGAEADADESFVHALAGRLGLDCIAERADVAARAHAEGANVEEAARRARLDFFRSLCARGQADAVATAHTLDDQAETLLARLLRGTGVSGLAGIQPVLELNPGRLVRPLLAVRRADLRRFLQERNQDWREDTSNLDPARTRNRLRLDLLPQLEHFNPAATAHLASLAAQASQEESFWRLFIEERFRALAREEQGAWHIAAQQLLEPLGDFYSAVSASPHEAEAAQRAVAQRLLRRLAEAARGDTRRLTSEHIEAILHLAASGQSGQRLDLPGFRVERVFGELVFRSQPVESPDYNVEVKVPGSVALAPCRHRLEFKLVAASDLTQSYNGVSAGALDAETLGVSPAATPGTLRLTVRNWRPGDRYRPQGAARAKKLKTLFQRAHVPAAERARSPVVVSAGRIIWAPRFGVAADCAVGEQTRTALVIRMEPLEE